jgi:hypothetical protein
MQVKWPPSYFGFLMAMMDLKFKDTIQHSEATLLSMSLLALPTKARIF